MHHARSFWLLGFSSSALVAALLASCSGHIGEPPGADCIGLAPGKSPIRRMTRFEYNNTVRDLLGDDTAPASAFVPEEEAMGFDNQAAALGVTQLLAEQYMVASEKIAARVVLHLSGLLPCDPLVDGEDACARTFISRFGR